MQSLRSCGTDWEGETKWRVTSGIGKPFEKGATITLQPLHQENQSELSVKQEDQREDRALVIIVSFAASSWSGVTFPDGDNHGKWQVYFAQGDRHGKAYLFGYFCRADNTSTPLPFQEPGAWEAEEEQPLERDGA